MADVFRSVPYHCSAFEWNSFDVAAMIGVAGRLDFGPGDGSRSGGGTIDGGGCPGERSCQARS